MASLPQDIGRTHRYTKRCKKVVNVSFQVFGRSIYSPYLSYLHLMSIFLFIVSNRFHRAPFTTTDSSLTLNPIRLKFLSVRRMVDILAVFYSNCCGKLRGMKAQ